MEKILSHFKKTILRRFIQNHDTNKTRRQLLVPRYKENYNTKKEAALSLHSILNKQIEPTFSLAERKQAKSNRQH